MLRDRCAAFPGPLPRGARVPLAARRPHGLGRPAGRGAVGWRPADDCADTGPRGGVPDPGRATRCWPTVSSRGRPATWSRWGRGSSTWTCSASGSTGPVRPRIQARRWTSSAAPWASGAARGPEISTLAASSLAGVSPDRVRPLLTTLARAHLVAEPVPGRYALHDLLRAYAAELGRAFDG